MRQKETSVATEETRMSLDERLELTRWLIDRYDQLRAATANRAALVVSADALLLAAMTFTLDKALSLGPQMGFVARIAVTLAIGATIALLALSIVYATNAVAFVWRTSREYLKFGDDMSQLPFFHPRDTVRAFSSLDVFEEGFDSTSKEQMLHYALGELLLITKAHYARYEILRRAMRWLLLAIVPFLVSIVMLFSGLFR